jgi:hypothetical protein
VFPIGDGGGSSLLLQNTDEVFTVQKVVFCLMDTGWTGCATNEVDKMMFSNDAVIKYFFIIETRIAIIYHPG